MWKALARPHRADCVFIIDTSLCHSPTLMCFSTPLSAAKKKQAAQSCSWQFSHQMVASVCGQWEAEVTIVMETEGKFIQAELT